MNIEKEKRIEEILLSLKKCDFLTREQLQKMHGLGGDRNAQRILSDMAEYVNFFFEDKRKIYYLNAVGRTGYRQIKFGRKSTKFIIFSCGTIYTFISAGRRHGKTK